MKIKVFLSTIGLCTCLTVLTGCSKDDFDAAAYTTAFLNAEYKGDNAEYAKFTGQDAAELTSQYESHIEELVLMSLGEDISAPGNEEFTPQSHDEYIELWKNILQKTNYKVTEAAKDGDNYTVTIETCQMNLYGSMNDILTEKLEEFYADETITPETDVTLFLNQMTLESYQESLDQLTYREAETIDVTLSRGEQSAWSISDEDMDILTARLIDLDAAAPGFDSPDSPDSPDAMFPQTEASPDMTAPENLDDAPVSQLGEVFTLQQDGVDVAAISIDKVESTEERSEFDPTNPEKVVVITYTYQNLAMDDPLLYDEMSFQVLEGDTVCPPYYLQSLIPADIALKGESSVTASISYGVSSSCKEVVIYVNGVQIDDPFTVTAAIS